LDQDQFRKTYHQVNERFCAYEKSILTNRCDCSQAERFCIAEREGVHCRSDAGQGRCLALLEFLRHQARFALKAAEGRSAMPHGKAMKVQVGGLRGLRAVLEPGAAIPERIDDVDGTIRDALGRFGSLDALPLQPIIQQIAAYRGRVRRRRR
jgi:hypothetical protein